MKKKLLILEDGTVFEGQAFGAGIDVTGELVFTKGMTGYQEAITDPTYNGQILTFTTPSLGNVGVHRRDYESISAGCKGVVVYEWSRGSGLSKNLLDLDEFLKKKSIPAIAGIDTRALERILRKKGSMKATLANVGDELRHLEDQLQATVLPTDNVKQVSTKSAYLSPGNGPNIVLIDLGLKHSILRELSKRNCNVTVVPYDTKLSKILEFEPDGLVLSSGPGNPEHLRELKTLIQDIQGKVPILGINLGHLVFSLANGAKLEKLKYGRRGQGYAVREIATSKIDFTSQNHGYVVSRKEFPEQLMLTHEAVMTPFVEGIRHRTYPALSVQFQPDASPGPHDASYIYDEFMDMIESFHPIFDEDR